ncbi:DNA polymerase eta [Hypsibius exemplaris]|uniref:DNA polymerase eta n=1 Tax=Hypsibius exemplaris TaxID=2072580 RepID=A0A1W0WY55_HYPEX|nr:DNA polymerase eta [Hypsibius exemplaris]
MASSSNPTLPVSNLKIDPMIALIDMDCFYVQVELRLQPQFRGLPSCVVQYKTRNKGGGIIALSYEARAKGVKRFHHGDEAREVCPEVKIFVVPELNGKADLTRQVYRDAGAEVIQVMTKKFSMVERASIDEAYVDLTSEVTALLPRYLSGELTLETQQLGATFVSGSDSVEAWLNKTHVERENAATPEDHKKGLNNLALGIAAKLINELREDILAETQFHCSAGISYSKTLGKLCCGINKPRKQTVLPADAVGALFAKTNITDVRALGGKLGKLIVENLGITTMGELCQVPKASLLRYFDLKTADWLMSISRGKDNETVQARDQPKSIGCSKNFSGSEALKTREDIRTWLNHFCCELSKRLKKDQADSNRTATLLTIYCTFLDNGSRKQFSKCAPLTSYEQEDMTNDGFAVADRAMTSLGFENGRYTHHLITLGITASKMKDGLLNSSNRIESYFNKSPKKELPLPEADGAMSEVEGDLPESPVGQEKEDVEADEDECQILAVNPNTFPSNEVKAQSKAMKVADCRPTTSKGESSRKFVDQPPGEEDSASKIRMQTEKLLYPDFKIHRCDREGCEQIIWYHSMQAEHADYHVAKDLSEQLDLEDSGAPRKKLKLQDVAVVKKPNKSSSPGSGSRSTLDRFLVKKTL